MNISTFVLTLFALEGSGVLRVWKPRLRGKCRYVFTEGTEFDSACASFALQLPDCMKILTKKESESFSDVRSRMIAPFVEGVLRARVLIKRNLSQHDCRDVNNFAVTTKTHQLQTGILEKTYGFLKNWNCGFSVDADKNVKSHPKSSKNSQC